MGQLPKCNTENEDLNLAVLGDVDSEKNVYSWLDAKTWNSNHESHNSVSNLCKVHTYVLVSFVYNHIISWNLLELHKGLQQIDNANILQSIYQFKKSELIFNHVFVLVKCE